ncbi:response regulator [Paenibacillus sp. RC67]|uniref:response regulator n=1 Tax=Paenibacillus sp. RC67 TaxID=3039392 RepID=UPI0024ACDC9F|nr:response regulator [Paenibacillus sp. RC67]
MQMNTEPLSVLIVDDELPLREELRFFPWQSCQAELVGEAENGEEALELCRKLNPDLVITDITMPVMNGLELFRCIKQQFPLTQVVLLTCHSDFDYAREALQLGALEYLIKVSLLDRDMEQVITKARHAIMRERNHMQSEKQRQRWQLSRMLVQSQASEEAGQDVSMILRQWNLEYPLQVIRLHTDAREEDEVYVHHELQALLTQRANNELMRSQWVPYGKTGDFLLLISDRTEISRIERLKQLERLLAHLQDELEKRLPYIGAPIRLFAVLGQSCGTIEKMLALDNSIRLPESSLFYDNTGTVYEGIAENTVNPLHTVDKEEHQIRIRQASATAQELTRYFREELTDWALERRPDPGQLKGWLLSLRKEWLRADDSGSEIHFANQLLRADTMMEFVSLMSRELEAAAGFQPKCRKEVVQAKKIISERLAEPITLTQIAEEVGLSSYYLSRLFREEAGESFNEFVTRLRMDKAVELLRTTHLKVYEVAERVGIPSYRYFSVLFRNRTGVAPTEYKKG